MKILVADDEKYEREAIAQLLVKSFGDRIEVRVAENGWRAIEVASLWRCNLAFLDIEMPGVNGLEAARQIKECNSSCEIVFLTAYEDFNYAQTAVRLGAKDYVLKPAKDEEILTIVRKSRGWIGQEVLQEETFTLGHDSVSTTRGAQVMHFVEEFLKQNYMHEISMNQLAKQVGFSSFYFSRLFLQYFKINFVDYLNDLRIDGAKRLLDDPTLTLKQVAVRSGYDTPSYFAKNFKKRTGMTPTEYRAIKSDNASKHSHGL